MLWVKLAQVTTEKKQSSIRKTRKPWKSE